MCFAKQKAPPRLSKIMDVILFQSFLLRGDNKYYDLLGTEK